jgi:hypothetical protein
MQKKWWRVVEVFRKLVGVVVGREWEKIEGRCC